MPPPEEGPGLRADTRHHVTEERHDRFGLSRATSARCTESSGTPSPRLRQTIDVWPLTAGAPRRLRRRHRGDGRDERGGTEGVPRRAAGPGRLTTVPGPLAAFPRTEEDLTCRRFE